MSSLSRIQRLVLLVAFLPQLLLLGLGSGTVVCVDQGGALHVEVGANACCTESAPATSGAQKSDAEEGSDCGSCADQEVAFEPLTSPDRNASQLEVPAVAILAMPVELPAIHVATSRDAGLWRFPDRGSMPPHLVRLRSVLLRC